MYGAISAGDAALVSFAPFAGSFLTTVVHRWPAGQSIVVPRSMCRRCGHVLSPFELIPVASFVVQKGRCRHCRERIDADYLLIELTALAIAVWAVFAIGGWIAWLTAMLGWLLLALAIIDQRHLFLPDLLTFPLLLAGLASSYLISGAQFADAAWGALGGFAAFYAVATAYRWLRGRDGLGLGDAKLLGAVGAWVGWQGLPSVVVLAALGALAVAVISGRLRHSLNLGARMPFGPYLAGAAWLVWLYGPLIVGGSS